MIKKLNLIQIVLEVLILVLIPLWFIIWGVNSPTTYIMTLFCLLIVHPIVYSIFLVIKEAKIMDYDSPKYVLVCMGITLLLGCVIWYLFFHLSFSFLNTISLWYALMLFAFSLPIVIVYLLAIFIGKKNNKGGPKFIKR